MCRAAAKRPADKGEKLVNRESRGGKRSRERGRNEAENARAVRGDARCSLKNFTLVLPVDELSARRS